MYVLQAEVTGDNFDTLAGNPDSTTSNNVLLTFPADRCFWDYNGAPEDGYNSGAGQYELSSAWFATGNGTNIALINPTLGSIGKSGRFVPSTL